MSFANFGKVRGEREGRATALQNNWLAGDLTHVVLLAGRRRESCHTGEVAASYEEGFPFDL